MHSFYSIVSGTLKTLGYRTDFHILSSHKTKPRVRDQKHLFMYHFGYLMSKCMFLKTDKHLPSKHEALSSNPGTSKTNKKPNNNKPPKTPPSQQRQQNKRENT
jgi:hypothetical protein